MSFSIAGNIRFLTDPKVEQNNSNVVKFLVGTEERKVNDKYVDNSIGCEAWGKLGETIAKNYKKGDVAFMSGSLLLNKWQDRSGENKERHYIRISSIEFVPRVKTSNGSGSSNQWSQNNNNQGPSNDDVDLPF